MPLVRWEPFREIDTLRREMDRLFENFSPPASGDKFGSAFVPPVEIKETDDAIDLKLEAPGLEAKDFDIEVTPEAVAIVGERKEETTSDTNGTKHTEFRYGKFERIVRLPAHIENTRVKAEYKDGILRLHLPKAEEEKHRVVKVNLES